MKALTSPRRTAVALAGGLALLLMFLAGLDRPAGAQAPGVISGVLRPGPGSDVSVSGIPVQLIEVRDTPVTVQETRTAAGRFRFEVPVASNPPVTYLIRALVDDVTYLAPDPVQLTPQRTSVQVQITVFGGTSERPALKASMSAMTIVAVDRIAGQITLQREDVIVNPTSRTWRGDSEGVSLLLPLPEGLISAEGQAWYEGLPTAGEFTPRQDGLAASVAMRPGETLLMTRFTVEANVTSPSLDVRLAAALPTDQMQIMAPERFVRRVTPLADGVRGDPLTIDGEKMTVVERLSPAQPGDALAARMFGLAAPIAPHPLSNVRNGIAGAVAATLILAGAGVVAARRTQAPARVVRA